MSDAPTPKTPVEATVANPRAPSRGRGRPQPSAAPADLALPLVESAASPVTMAAASTLADDIRKEITTYLDAALPAPAQTADKVCGTNPKQSVAAPCFAREHALAIAESDYATAKRQADFDLDTALGAWTAAQSVYHSVVKPASSVLDGALTAETRSYRSDQEDHQEDDVLGRNAHVLATKRSAIVQALQAYGDAVGGARTTLASRIGDVYAAYAAYAAAITKAEIARAAEIAAAELAFWDGVDPTLRAEPLA